MMVLFAVFNKNKYAKVQIKLIQININKAIEKALYLKQ